MSLLAMNMAGTASTGDLVPDSDKSQPRATMYKYDALPSDSSFRLLTLLPGNGSDDVLRGRLESVAVQDVSQYETLSYVWGAKDLTHTIHIGENVLGITASLYQALKRLRLPDKQRRIWADQVCINQTDTDERSQQVQFMDKIYEKAHHVLVWLGQDEEGRAEGAFALVENLDAIFSNDTAMAKFRSDHAIGTANQNPEYWAPLRHITELPWFRRAWVVQEAGTMVQATIFWGQAEIDWSTLHRVTEKLSEFHHLRVQFEVNTSDVKYIYRRFVEPEKNSRHANRFDFIYELHRARGLNASDDRDRVHAMLGHYSIRRGSNPQLRHLRAAYQKSVEEIYTEVAVKALTGDDKSLITLAAVQHEKLTLCRDMCIANREGSYLPSWAPDWRTRPCHILSEPTSSHRASGERPPNLSIDSACRVLNIHGVRFDSLRACSPVLKPKEFHLDTKEDEVPAILRLWNTICHQTRFDLMTKYPTGDSCFFAYTQTLSSGCNDIAWRLGRPYGEFSKDVWLQYGAAYVVKATENRGIGISREIRCVASIKDPKEWSRSANGASSHRRFAITTKGYYVLGPKVMEEGDVICILFGGKMPFCLRPCESHYHLVGECYVYGLMKGEAIHMLEKDDINEESFNLV